MKTLDLIKTAFQPINMHRQFGLIVPTERHLERGDYVVIREYTIPEGTNKGLVKNYTGREKEIQIQHVLSGPKAGLYAGYSLVSFLYC